MLTPGGSAQSAGTKDTFYLFGGVALSPGLKGTEREYLTDCHAFTLGKEWRRLAPLPRGAAAGPCAAMAAAVCCVRV